jgi:hypothetical protein
LHHTVEFFFYLIAFIIDVVQIQFQFRHIASR